MSELGSNQGQDENKNTPVFDSANLAEKQKAEHFTNVEGNEARAKQAERQAEAMKKKAEAARTNEVKKAAKKEVSGNKKTKKKTTIIAVAIVIGVLLAGFLWVWFIGGGAERNRLSNDAEAKEYALDVYREIEDVQSDQSLDQACEKMESIIDNASEEQKVYLSMYYAEFLAVETSDAISARKWLEKAESYSKNDNELNDVKNEYAKIAMLLGDESFDKYGALEGE